MITSPLKSWFGKRRVYLDHASITPIDPRVQKTMLKTMRDLPANPSSLYKEGVLAKKAMDKARKGVADFLEVHPTEITFTSGGTEANNLALHGLIDLGKEVLKKGKNNTQEIIPHIVTLSIEHPSIIEVLDHLKSLGKIDVTYIAVAENGIVDPREIKKAIRPETVLVTAMTVNNEIGTIQPIAEIAKAIRSYRKEMKNKESELPFFHTDASQAALYEELRVPAQGIDSLTLDASKVYGPRGIGALYVRRDLKIAPITFGGGQEKDIRPGTENLPAIVGFVEALTIAKKERERQSSSMILTRDLLWKELKEITPEISLNGDPVKRSPNNLNICMPGTDAEFLVLKLDAHGIAVSSVTSCRNSKEDTSSYVIEALGKKDCAASSLRITFGRFTTASDLKFFLKKYKKLFAKKT